MTPDARHYRYTVKCDRAFNVRLEKAAKTAGVPVTAFLQGHFDAILAGPVKLAKPFDRSKFDMAGFAKTHGVSWPAARVWAALRKSCTADMQAAVPLNELAESVGLGPGALAKARDELVDAGLIRCVKRGGSAPRRVTVWQVSEGG